MGQHITEKRIKHERPRDKAPSVRATQLWNDLGHLKGVHRLPHLVKFVPLVVLEMYNTDTTAT